MVSPDHETSCFYGILTTDPICTTISWAGCPVTGGGGSGQLEGICPVSSSSAIFHFSSIKQCQDYKIEHNANMCVLEFSIK